MKMKTFVKLLCLLIMCLVVSSCATKQKITVFGTPGTEILGQTYKKIGTIQSDGQLQLKIKLDDDIYFSYLLSHTPGTDEYVPFALDYKYKNYSTGHNIATLCLCTGVGLPIAVIMSPFIGNGNNMTHQYDFKYLKAQRTNDNFVFTAYENTGERRKVGVYAGIGTASGGTTADKVGQKGVSMARPRTQKATRTLRDYGKAVAGTYRGTGRLKQGETVVESYRNMAVTIERTDKNSVTVSVIDDYGEPFFSSKGTYNIKKESGQSYRLTLDGIPSATISVDGNGKLVYIHPKVSIDGEIYTLEISALKQ